MAQTLQVVPTSQPLLHLWMDADSLGYQPSLIDFSHPLPVTCNDEWSTLPIGRTLTAVTTDDSLSLLMEISLAAASIVTSMAAGTYVSADVVMVGYRAISINLSVHAGTA